MMRAFGTFLAYWFGSSILLTILSLWMWDAVFLHQTIGLGFLGAIAWVLIDRWQAWAENRRAARDLEPVGAGEGLVEPYPVSQHIGAQTPAPGSAARVQRHRSGEGDHSSGKAAGIALGLVYLLGYWLYGVWYAWEHWAGY